MRSILTVLALALLVAATAPVSAQDNGDQPKAAKPPATVSQEAPVLKKLVGQWMTESETIATEEQPAFKCSGKMHSRAIGGFWVMSELEAEMTGTKIQAVQTLGYDEKSKKYVGTWIDNMSNHMWKYKGTYHADDNRLSLEADGPNMLAPEKTATFRDEYKFMSDDEIVLTSSMLHADGKWKPFMKGRFRRVK